MLKTNELTVIRKRNDTNKHDCTWTRFVFFFIDDINIGGWGWILYHQTSSFM